MTLQTLLIYIGLAAIVLTVLIGLLKKGHKSWVMTFLQNFTGILFLVSGFVKAVDPLGTAYKMEQYFTEFQYAFADTSAAFMAPLFPALSSVSIWFSVIMIVFEMVLGLMLILGHKPKLSSWLFLLLVLFFTVLTGFTYLTGYVPSEGNFFKFASWGPYSATNMKVTDCGCFGDFIRLEPKISFFKDVFLLLPAIYFVIRHRDMHQLFSPRTRSITLTIAALTITLFCVRNSFWGLPVIDFRPFKIGTDLYAKKTAEEEAQANVKVTLRMKNNNSGEIIEIPQETYMAEWQKYPKEEWTTIEQIRGKPAIEETKVSQFSIIDRDGYDVAEDILTDSGHVFLIVAYKLKGDVHSQEVMSPDTVWSTDTVRVENSDVQTIVKTPSAIGTKKMMKEVYVWDEGYVKNYVTKVNPLMEMVMQQGASVYAAAGGAGTEMLDAFKQAIGSPYDWYEADDILLKTIIRSNPGVVHIKGGRVLDMWHIRSIPESIQLD